MNKTQSKCGRGLRVVVSFSSLIRLGPISTHGQGTKETAKIMRPSLGQSTPLLVHRGRRKKMGAGKKNHHHRTQCQPKWPFSVSIHVSFFAQWVSNDERGQCVGATDYRVFAGFTGFRWCRVTAVARGSLLPSI